MILRHCPRHREPCPCSDACRRGCIHEPMPKAERKGGPMAAMGGVYVDDALDVFMIAALTLALSGASHA